MCAGWPSITSVKISPSPAQSACYTVTVSLQSDSPVTRVGFLYSGPGLQGTRASVVPSGLPGHTSVVSHRWRSGRHCTLSSIQCTTAAGNVTWSSPAPTLCLYPPPTLWAAAPPPSTTSPPSTSPSSTSSGQGQAGTLLNLLL